MSYLRLLGISAFGVPSSAQTTYIVHARDPIRRLAALMHDVGKVDAAYEASAEYFSLHEVRSADFAYEVMLKVKERSSMPPCNPFAEPSLLNVALLAIASHHHLRKTYGHHSVVTLPRNV
jgi:hypothetical protein